MADRIAVMEHGRVVQLGTPESLYETPGTPFVARFLGDSNAFGGTLSVRDGRATLVDGDARWLVALDEVARVGLADGVDATVVVRPERMTIVGAAAAVDADVNAVSGTLAETVYLGAARKLVVDLAGGRSVQVRLESRADATALATGDAVVVAWQPSDGVLVPGRVA